MTLARGDRVQIRPLGTTDWRPATVALVSSNGLSIGLALDNDVAIRLADGMVMGALPIMRAGPNRFVGLLGEEYEMRPEPSAN